MKPNHLRLFVVLLSALAPLGLLGATFDYSYTFSSPIMGPGSVLVSGEIEGVRNGDYVENISNVTMAFNGSQPNGAIRMMTQDASFGNWFDGGTVSFTATSNNFIFANGDANNGPGAYLRLLGSTSIPGYHGDQVFSFDSDLGFFGTGTTTSGNWTLTERSANASVPDSGASAVMLGLGLLGLAGVRRRFATA